MDDLENMINALSDKELIIRVDLKQYLKIVSFKVGSIELEGELGISFRRTNEEEKSIESPEKVEIEEQTITEEKEKKVEKEKERESETITA